MKAKPKSIGEALAQYLTPRDLRVPPADERRVTPLAEALSARQREILRRISQGQPDKVIASELNCSENTINSQVRRVFEKLHIHTRTEAAYAWGCYVTQTSDTQSSDRRIAAVGSKMAPC
jgi:DNA-binding NarL/FixJ family response regulator